MCRQQPLHKLGSKPFSGCYGFIWNFIFLSHLFCCRALLHTFHETEVNLTSMWWWCSVMSNPIDDNEVSLHYGKISNKSDSIISLYVISKCHVCNANQIWRWILIYVCSRYSKIYQQWCPRYLYVKNIMINVCIFKVLTHETV